MWVCNRTAVPAIKNETTMPEVTTIFAADLTSFPLSIPQLIGAWAGESFTGAGNATQALFDIMRSWNDGTTLGVNGTTSSGTSIGGGNTGVSGVDAVLNGSASTVDEAVDLLEGSRYNVTRVREILDEELAAQQA